MNPKWTPGAAWLGASLVPALLGLAASSLLAVDYLRPRPVFCEEGGGCEAVRNTVFAAPLGVPTPLIGLVGFLAIGWVALLPGTRARMAQLALALGAGVVGVVLILVQARMGVVCPYCMVADVCAIASAAAAAGRFRIAPGASAPRALSGVGVALLLATIAVPLAIGFRARPVPRVIREEIARTPRGHVCIVDFVDFECPFCRMTHAVLEPLVQAHLDRVRVLRMQVPLHVHPHALEAARAACCGERLGRGDAMADALFGAPVADLTREGCQRIAERLGLPADDFRACVADPGTAARIDQDRAKFKAAGGSALPTLWIGDLELIGAQSSEALTAVIDSALAGAGS